MDRAGLQNPGLEFFSAERLVDKTGNACMPGPNNLG
jgi:hypothetical protein